MNKRLFLSLLLASVVAAGCNTRVKNFTATTPNKNILLNLHNKERADRRMSLLQLDQTLSDAAQKYAEEMARTGKFEHGNVAKRIGSGWMAYGENIAMGQTSNEEVMNDWMDSIGHKRNILNKNFQLIGIGIAKNSNGEIYWVVDFGTK